MKAYRFLSTNGAVIENRALEKHLEKLASNQTIKPKSDKYTNPIPRLQENYQAIKEIYGLLNDHLRIGIAIHPAGEWILDNFYIIEEIVKSIEKDLTQRKYTHFAGIQNGEYAGFARIYVLACEIVKHTDSKIERDTLENFLKAYQTNKTLSMDEIWNIGLFLQIALIEKIRQICEVIFISQMQKFKAESIVERLIDNKGKTSSSFKRHFKVKNFTGSKAYPFIEYMSYTLKRHGKQAASYLHVLEETVEKAGTTVSSIIKKEHFNIAIQKVSMGNSITSIKEIQRINFLEIFEKINGVEEILNNDPANVYSKMDHKTKELYRGKIKQISKKAKVSEMYTAKKVLQLARENKDESKPKQSHIGYYLIDSGIHKLYKELQYIEHGISKKSKVKLYIFWIALITVALTIAEAWLINKYTNNVVIFILSAIVLFVPTSELIIQIVQYFLGKLVKPKPIPKVNFYDGIDTKNATMVVIPTIVKSKEKVQDLMKSLEVFYLANKSKNLYFALLGDCSEAKNKDEAYDQEVADEGLKQAERLNRKYENDDFPIFHFLYRNRKWNEKENCYIGWERKRGLLTQFNEYLLENSNNDFKANTIENFKQSIKENQNETSNKKVPKIKYIITLDADTELPLNSAFELVGAMAHILNKPILNKQKNAVIGGHALIQPRVGVSLDISYKNLFTQIFAGAGGIDSYTNAISDTYQDNFDEGIFTGKGIYDLEAFSQVLKDQIPENTVLSHDLLEGSYLRCGLATDIMLIDGYPSKYTSFMNRLSRWTRGDWQISRWIFKGPLNLLSKYKIFDNLRRSVFEVSIIMAMLFFIVTEFLYNTNPKTYIFQCMIGILLGIVCFPFLLEIINQIVFKKEGEKKQKPFTPKIDGFLGAIIRSFLTIGCLPHKAYVCETAKWKTLYRLTISHRHLLEWTTSEEAEKLSKTDIFSYYKTMFINVLFGIGLVTLGIAHLKIFYIILGAVWIITPSIMCSISKENRQKQPQDRLTAQEKEYLKDVAKKTWDYFSTYLNEENNYLIPDNYQEDRNPLVIDRTSSTNIGLSILAVISSLDLGFAQKNDVYELLEKMINTIDALPKWCGHLYNWYNIKTKQPLFPRYISTVDSGNFVGYMYVLKSFLEDEISGNEKGEEKNKLQLMHSQVENIIKATDFSMLYSKERRLFSIGYNIEENKLTNSYYDLLASEARQASFIAIAQGSVPAKHWSNLSRTMTTLNDRKGLVSWSGTAFEYLMPNINIPKYKGSLLDESCKFAIASQIEYSKRLGIPWGISEAAFNAKDLYSNYQYKAFGIPWLGLKRGLADEMVVASYGSILAVGEKPKGVVNNLKQLEKQGMYDKFGFYESIDYTPARASNGKIGSPVKTYMAHHQGLILLSINNLFNNNILQKRFMQNPEASAVRILLQERMPNKSAITKESKEKVEKLKYKDYEDYSKTVYNKVDARLIRGNVISNANYTVAINQKGAGFSKYKDYYINRFKQTDDYPQGIFFYIKSLQSGKIWSTNYNECLAKPDKYSSSFMPDKSAFERIDGNIKTKMKITVAPNEPVEIRRLELKNLGNSEEMLEITSFFEPVLSSKEKDYAHPAFNNLFLSFEYDEELESFIIKRNKRAKAEKELYLISTLSTDGEKIGDIEFEIDKEKFNGRANFEIPKMVGLSIPLSKKIGLVTEPVACMKRTIKIQPGEKVCLDLIISVEFNKEIAIDNLKKYMGAQNVRRTFELSKARVEAESRYLGIKGKDIESYQKMMSYVLFDNPIKKQTIKKLPSQKYKQSDLWKYGISGDLPIILVKIKDANDAYVVENILKAYEYFRSKNIWVEIVILDEEKHSYENYVKEEIEACILNSQMSYLKNVKGGIFVLSKDEIDGKDLNLLKFVSNIIIDGHLGNIEHSLKDIEDEYLENYVKVWDDKKIPIFTEDSTQDIDILSNQENLKYYNEYGAFSKDGKEYLIRTNKQNRLPTVWTHVLANKNFGTIVTENMGGYTWYKNSRLNRVTSWHNYACLDIPSEVIYAKDEETGKVWSVGASPMPDEKNYNVIYGFGYAKYIHQSMGVCQELCTFVPKEDSAKVSILKLRNLTPNKKKLKLFYYAKIALGEDEIKSDGYIRAQFQPNNNMLEIKNLYENEIENTVAFISSSEKIKSYTGDKKFFFGKGGISNPEGLKKISLNNETGLGEKACAVIEVDIEIESFAEREISFALGATDKEIEAKDLAYKYSKVHNCNEELSSVKKYWQELLGRVQVSTPIESVNIMLNGWAMYQTIACRMLGKSGYYQSGGAFGFRDQLQDALGTKYLDTNILKEQIIKHSKHQFLEGDVEHWWHEETQRGIRTRFSDDLLWLPYAVIEYIEFTGDTSILDVETNYLNGEKLKQGEDEKYDRYLPSDTKESILMHCIRAINHSLNFGEHDLPKIGSGDWNDGFSEVGNKGKGESVWLGFFLYLILEKDDVFWDGAKKQLSLGTGEKNISADVFFPRPKKHHELKKALNTNGWDGRWYKRAFMDNGDVLGSMENEECRIDGISQSWSVISGAGDNDKKYISMQSLETHLVDKEIGIIKLLDPPFNKSSLEPGYIKAYMPGVRENGGQYTHAAVWAIIAESLLGFGDKAMDWYKMINPIEHSRVKDAANKYKVEPYVIPADVYGSGNLAGRGGWTWYTGSSSWFYKAGIEYILGLKIKGNTFTLEPCIPKGWKEYNIRYEYKSSVYDITVKNLAEKEAGKVKEIFINGNMIGEKYVEMLDSGQRYKIKIILE